MRDPALRVLAAAAVEDDGRVLLIREEDEPFRKSWVVPQGDPRPGESLAEAARREAREEVGLDVEIDSLLGVYEAFSPSPTDAPRHWVIVAFRARPVTGSGVRPTPEAIDSAWIHPRAPPRPVPPFVRQMLRDLAARS